MLDEKMCRILPRLVMMLSFRVKCVNGLQSFLPRSTTLYHRSFHLTPARPCIHSTHSTHSYGRFCPPLASASARLGSTSSSSNADDLRRIESVDSHLSQLRALGRITTEEAKSISSALFNSASDDTTKSIINDSIDTYLSMKKRRTEANGESIENPGLYVRSIVRKQLEIVENNEPSRSKRSQKRVEPVGQNSNDPLLQPFMKRNEIGPNELNGNCLLALSKCTAPMVDNALKAYAKQKRRREMNGTEQISDPSSYVMAVLRNNMFDATGFSPLSPVNSLKSNDPKNESAPTIEKKSGSSTENTIPPTPMKRRAGSKFASEITKPTKRMPSRQSPDQTQRILSNRIQQEKDKTAVNMDYVDKCISYLVKLEQPIIQLVGVGPKTESAFHKLGIYTLRDLLWHFPRSFIDRSKLEKNIHNIPDGEVGTFPLIVHADRSRGNTVPCTDEAGNDVDVTFFYGRSRQGMSMASAAMKKLCEKDAPSNSNRPTTSESPSISAAPSNFFDLPSESPSISAAPTSHLPVPSESPSTSTVHAMIISGKIKHLNQKAELFNPDIVVPSDQADSILGIDAVYALSSGLSRNKLISAIDDALVVAGELLGLLPESLPQNVLQELRWPKLADALILAHKPTSIAETELDSPARQRIAFEELAMQQAQLALSRWKLKHHGVAVQSKEVYPRWRDSPLVSAAVSSLPFDLTPSQMKCLDEMWDDAIGDNSNGRMIRILQGDVGSGKTVLAYLVGLGCIESRQGGGRVVSLLCPTQLLAAQHKQSISDFAARMGKKSDWNIRVELLTGNVVGASRNELLARLEIVSENDAVFLIGTHALTTPEIVGRLKQLPSVHAADTNGGLALAVIDEEHRFGVRQRQSLTSCAAHTLHMSATPIPRSISLMRSGLMDFTLLQSEPRQLETTIVSSDNLEKVVTVLHSRIDAGSKCFWVLPRIMENKAHQSNVIERYNALAKTLGEERVCHIHGRMSEREREEQLARFVNPSSKAAVLVGTTIIEVGIDIPDVNILIVEDADCFGLSQLHQLRGRIGRAGSRPDLKCNCLLLSGAVSVNQEDSSLSRLQILQRSNSGEQIADADFMLRGPGEMLGFLQSGIKVGFTVDPANHWDLLEAATQFGRSFLQQPSNMVAKDGDVRSPVNDALAKLLAEGKMTSSCDQTKASSSKGLGLRLMMSLFGEWKSDEGNTLDAINTLQHLDASKGELSQDDRSIDAKIVAMIEASVSPAKTPSGLDKSVLPIKPHVEAQKYQIPMESRLNLSGDDVFFLVLDVETTGLHDKSCHVIQLAAKVLGSDDENDLFSEYILPPIDRIPKKIEELTGITDDFLRHGGYDPALNKETGMARDFRHVFLDFQAFCNQRAEGREIVFVAHNAKFDIRMINGELRRWRLSEHAATAPVLGDIFSCSLDTLHLFRDRKWWRSTRPSSFSLSELHSHVFNESISNSHNAVGDIKALERLLQSESFNGWESIGNKIQAPFLKFEG